MSNPRCPKCGTEKGGFIKDNMPAIITVIDPNSFCPYLFCQVCRYRSPAAEFDEPQMPTYQGWRRMYEKLQTMGV